MSNSPILDRIKKLLRMKRGGTPAEIETALGLARKIAAQHGIDLDAVDPDEKAGSQFRHESAYLARRVPGDAKLAAKICQEFFNVQAVFYEAMHGFGIYFVGRGFEIEIALYIFRFLRGHFSRAWRSRDKRLRSRRSFIYGMHLGIWSKLREEQVPEQSTALIETREGYLKEAFPGIKSLPAKAYKCAHRSLRAGFSEGLKTELRKGVERPRPMELGIEI